MYSSYRDLEVWQKSMDLAVEIYELSKQLPSTENYALADQMRRAVVSIPSNIAEGHGRGTEREFQRFLAIANGSCAELQTQLLLSERIGYLSHEQTKTSLLLTESIMKMLYSLSKSLNSKPKLKTKN